jgi:CTD small phosphatase-like protein 2
LETTLTFRAEPNPLFTKSTSKKLTIVFDLDETLIKSVSDPLKLPDENYDIFIRVEDGAIKRDLYVSFRPYMTQMLKKLKKHCELIVFTAAQKQYAESIIQSMSTMAGGEPLFDHILTREFCYQMPKPNAPDQSYYLKDLRVMLDGRKLNEMILIDNRAIGFAGVHLTNGIPIKDYEGDRKDTELWGLTDYLMQSFILPCTQYYV